LLTFAYTAVLLVLRCLWGIACFLVYYLFIICYYYYVKYI